MGSDRYVHIGTYMTVKGQETKDTVNKYRACTYKGCDKYNIDATGNYCDSCGHIVEEITNTKKQIIPASIWLINWIVEQDNKGMDIGDDLFWTEVEGNKGEIFFIGNRKDPFKRLEDNIVDMSNIDQKAEIYWFENKYKVILDAARGKFGNDSVIIKWGMVKYWN